MDSVSIPSQPLSAASRRDQMMTKAKELEASFLAEMLSHAGLAEMTGPFGGGSGEAQFSSFLRGEEAKLVVKRGGVGLAELIFESMVKADHVTRA